MYTPYNYGAYVAIEVAMQLFRSSLDLVVASSSLIFSKSPLFHIKHTISRPFFFCVRGADTQSDLVTSLYCLT